MNKVFLFTKFEFYFRMNSVLKLIHDNTTKTINSIFLLSVGLFTKKASGRSVTAKLHKKMG